MWEICCLLLLLWVLLDINFVLLLRFFSWAFLGFFCFIFFFTWVQFHVRSASLGSSWKIFFYWSFAQIVFMSCCHEFLVSSSTWSSSHGFCDDLLLLLLWVLQQIMYNLLILGSWLGLCFLSMARVPVEWVYCCYFFLSFLPLWLCIFCFSEGTWWMNWQVHILPREVFGKSTFAVAMKLVKNFPLWFADSFLVWYTWALMGDTSSYGLHRPAQGPMTLKLKFGKTPVLDVGTFAKVKNGDIKVTTSIYI